MAAVVPNRPKNQFNLLSQARRQPGSTFKTFVLAAAVEQGVNPDSTYYVSAPFTARLHPAGNCDDGSWWCVKTYANDYYGWSSDPQRDAALGQHGLRAADARPDPAEGRRGRPSDGRALAAGREGRVRALDRARLDRGVASRHRVGVRDARRRRRLRGADGDPPRRPRGRHGRHGRRLGLPRDAAAPSPRALPRSSRASSSRTSSRGRARAPRSGVRPPGRPGRRS